MNGVRTLVTGQGLVESPRWHDDRLYFSDWSAGEVLGVDLAGDTEVVARVKSLPLCTAWLPDGRLVIVSSPDGRLLRREPDGSLVTHADLGETGWNDIVVDGRGNAYVNRIGFNPMAAAEFTPGLVHLATPAGSVRQVADDIAFPNGMAVSPDNATLIVADSYRHHLVAFDIGADGSSRARRSIARPSRHIPNFPGQQPGLPFMPMRALPPNDLAARWSYLACCQRPVQGWMPFPSPPRGTGRRTTPRRG